MSSTNPTQLHHHYSHELDLDDALPSKKARCCPVWIKRKRSICDWSIGLFRTDRILYMLEDLHFCKSVPLNPFTNVFIARLAWNIAKASFCSKHEPEAHIAKLRTRFDTIRQKALDCPVFSSPGPENIEEYQSSDLGRMLTGDFGRMFSALDFPPSTPPNAKHARDDEDDTPPPAPVKRARHTPEQVQHDHVIWQELFRQCATDANALVPTGSNSSSTVPFDYANHFSTSANPINPPFMFPYNFSAGANPINPPSMFPYNFSAGPDPVNPPAMLSCNGNNNPVWSSESVQRANDMMIQQLFPDHVDDQPTGPSAAKLARVAASRYPSPSNSMPSNPDVHQDWLDLLDPNKPFPLSSHQQPGLDSLDQHEPLSQHEPRDGVQANATQAPEAQLNALVGGQEQPNVVGEQEQPNAVGGGQEQPNAVVGGQEQVEVAPPGDWLAFQGMDFMADFDMAEFNRLCDEYHRDVVAPSSSTTASILSGTSDVELVESDAGESLVSLSKAQGGAVGGKQVGQEKHDGQEKQVGQDGQDQQVGQDQHDGQEPEGGVWSPPEGWAEFLDQVLNEQSEVEQSGSAAE